MMKFNFFTPGNATKTVIPWDIVCAEIDKCRHSPQGFVIGADLGKSLQAKID